MQHLEKERINSVKRFEDFDFAYHNGLQNILEIAAGVYQTPAAFITLLDENDQIFKVNHGFQVFTMPRDTSFCTHTILLHEPMIVSDALADERFSDSPLVVNAPNIRFYAGAALSGYDGMNVGTLCVMDDKPKEISRDMKRMLLILAKQAIHLMELELNYKYVSHQLEVSNQQNAALKDIAYIQAYEFRRPLGKVKELLNTIKENNFLAPQESLCIIEDAVNKLDKKIKTVEESNALILNSFAEDEG